MEPDKATKGFNVIPEGSIDIVQRDRILNRQNFSQFTNISGSNKTIVINDGDNDRVITGVLPNG